MGQSLLQNGLFQRGKVNFSVEKPAQFRVKTNMLSPVEFEKRQKT